MNSKLPNDASSLLAKIGNPSGIVIAIDGNYNISYFSDEAVKLFGYKPAEVLGKSLVELLPKYARKKHDEYVDHFAASEGKERAMGDRMAVSGLNKDGEILILDVFRHPC